MAKLTKDEIKQKISEKIVDNDDLVIELLEDIEDSFDVSSDLESQIENLRQELETRNDEVSSLKKKYKERFLGGITNTNEKIDVTPDLTEEQYIDVRSI